MSQKVRQASLISLNNLNQCNYQRLCLKKQFNYYIQEKKAYRHDAPCTYTDQPLH